MNLAHKICIYYPQSRKNKINKSMKNKPKKKENEKGEEKEK